MDLSIYASLVLGCRNPSLLAQGVAHCVALLNHSTRNGELARVGARDLDDAAEAALPEHLPHLEARRAAVEQALDH